jgi:feruloyl esterase
MSRDLSEFKARGGKLILYHGWNDQLIQPENTINYYSEVVDAMSGAEDDWLRLFMVPAMNHCRGGDGPSQIDWLSSLERWRESDTAPDSIPAFRVQGNTVDMSRPVCAYPRVATWTGVGSTNDAANFTCELP